MNCYICKEKFVAKCFWCEPKLLICSDHCFYVYDDNLPLTCCINCITEKSLIAKENYFLEDITIEHNFL